MSRSMPIRFHSITCCGEPCAKVQQKYILGNQSEFRPGCNITIHKGGLAMKSNNYLIGLSIMFFVFAAAFSVVFWGDVSLAAKAGLFVLGFASGVTAGQWFARRSA